MTYAAVPAGLMYPDLNYLMWIPTAGLSVSSIIDAATEKIAFIGHCYIEGRAASKTISAAGGGSISWRAGTVTFANGATTVDIGIQDVSATAGPSAQPDGTFDVKNTFTGGGGGITTAAWNTNSMTGGTGSKTISHGDLIAVVFDMTARGGADSIAISCLGAASAQNARPAVAAFLAGAWSVAFAADRLPICVITFDDGTLGYIDGCPPISVVGAEVYGDATNPDERGIIFRVPWNVKIDAFWAALGGNTDTAADMTLKLYSTPLGTPSLVTSKAILSEQISSTNGQAIGVFSLASEVELTRNTDYVLSLLATGNNIDLRVLTIADEDYRSFGPAGTTLAKATRDGSSGAFTAESPAITIPVMGIRISQFDDGTGAGAGGGLLAHPGMRGGFV